MSAGAAAPAFPARGQGGDAGADGPLASCLLSNADVCLGFCCRPGSVCSWSLGSGWEARDGCPGAVTVPQVPDGVGRDLLCGVTSLENPLGLQLLGLGSQSQAVTGWVIGCCWDTLGPAAEFPSL